MQWLAVVAVIVIALTALYTLELAKLTGGQINPGYEGYADYVDGVKPDRLGAVELNNNADLASLNQGPPLSDFLQVKSGLTPYAAGSCFNEDQATSLEPGGQYVQRTNNYRHDYPDNCSALLSEFVGSVYAPKSGAVGVTVPCAGKC